RHSTMTLVPSLRSTSTASRMEGSSLPSKFRSRIGPVMRTTVPTLSPIYAPCYIAFFRLSFFNRRGAGYYFRDLAGDGGLPCAVIAQQQPIQHLVGVLGSRVHGSHA